MNSTIYEVAKRAGVSTATVSHVLNRTRYVSDELKARVMAAIKELNYKPNTAARRLRDGNSKAIGLIVPDCTNPFFAEIARAVDRVCFSLGYNIILCNTDNSAAHQTYYLDMLISKQVDGVIFISCGTPDCGIQKCETACIPAVIVDRDANIGRADRIIINNEQGGYDAAKYLIQLGFTKIGCIAGPAEISSSIRRTEGFKRALKEHGIPLNENLIYNGDFHYKGGKDAFAHFQNLPEQPEAVFACNDMMAIGFIHAAAANGVSVPGDVSVIGFDNTELAAVISPNLTTIAQPIEEIAEIATKRLLKRIEAQDGEVKRIVLEPRLIVRETCRQRNPPV
ncbi:MAG: LacI family DNA-binding transcriptional regulator [Treponema sp.]